mmetsp:Transcript_43756/g.31896  ORF Transcript_43756/g.31896 Transcript_43756/m.31896 type:complete len:132 (+) Transcript_43756:452-847(+)
MFTHIYKGFWVMNIRNSGLLVIFFSLLDSVRRHTNLFNHKVGQFFGTGTCSCLCFWAIWPFEFLKNQIQSENAQFEGSITERFKNIIRTHGPLGIYRGLLAGSLSIFIRNGCAMIVMQWAQKKLTEMGFRD